MGPPGRCRAGQSPAGGLGAAGPRPARAEPRPASTPRAVAAALSRVEAREWLSSPWFGTGIGFCILLTAMFGWFWANEFNAAWGEWFGIVPITVHPLVGMAVVTAHAAVTRARRDGVDELFESCPTEESTVTAAHIRAAWVPALTAAVYIAGDVPLLTIRNDQGYGPIDARAAADVVGAILLGSCGALLGVALARWAPWRLVPVVFVVLLLPLILGLGDIGEPHWSNARQLSTWPRYPNHDLLFTDPPTWSHVVWLLALCSFVIWVALIQPRSRRTLVAGASLAIVVAGVGVVMTRPLSDAAAGSSASMVANPDHHQTCVTVPGVEVCVFERYAILGDRVLREVAPVVAASPTTSEPPRCARRSKVRSTCSDQRSQKHSTAEPRRPDFYRWRS